MGEYGYVKWQLAVTIYFLLCSQTDESEKQTRVLNLGWKPLNSQQGSIVQFFHPKVLKAKA